MNPVVYKPDSLGGLSISGSIPLIPVLDHQNGNGPANNNNNNGNGPIPFTGKDNLFLRDSESEQSLTDPESNGNGQETERTEKYERLRVLGRGASGTVWLARRAADNKEIALKEINIPRDAPAVLENAEQEVEFLKRISYFPKCHPFITCYYGSEYNLLTSQFFIEMEYIRGKDMGEFIKDFKSLNSLDLTYYYLLLIAKDLATGLEYIHSQGIIHNDIKLENILIDSEYSPHIGDFGLSCFSEKSGFFGPRFCLARGGTVYYIPIEFFTMDKRFPASDMWALGITLFIAATGKWPYPGTTYQAVVQQIKNNPAPQLNTTNIQLNNIVNKLLVKNYQDRLTAKQVVNMLKIIPRPAERAQIPSILPSAGVSPIHIEPPIRPPGGLDWYDQNDMLSGRF